MKVQDQALREESVLVVVQAQALLALTGLAWHELVLGDWHVPLFVLHDVLLVVRDNSIDHILDLGLGVVQMSILQQDDRIRHNSSIV